MDVKSTIKLHGLTIGDVAKEMGITRETLSRNLSNNPTIGTLRKVADVLGCSVAEFFADEVESPKPSYGIACPHCGGSLEIEVNVK